jgi:hypothetical protein
LRNQEALLHPTAIQPVTQAAMFDPSAHRPMTSGEKRAVQRSKFLVYVALFMAAATIGTLTFFFTSNEETSNTQENVSTTAGLVSSLATD